MNKMNDNYWKKNIIDWEKSVYENKNKFNLLEWLASFFRKPLIYRKNITINFLKKFGKDKIISELGCGTGRLILTNYNIIQAKKIYGFDISEDAVKTANEMVKNINQSENIIFKSGQIPEVKIPESDIIFGLGFLDYLSNEEITELVNELNCKYFLFSFSKYEGLAKFHNIYMFLKGCHKHYYISENEIKAIFSNKFDNIKTINDKKLSFGSIIHNFPE